MTVTLTTSCLLQPTGELDAALFVSTDNVDVLLAGWLQDAIGKAASVTAANQDAAATAWVYHRAFSLFAQRAALTAAEITVDGTVTKRTATDQRKYFADQAAYWRNEFDRLSTTVPTAATTAFFGRVRARADVNSIYI